MKLTELYSTTFAKKIKETIGSELNEDLQALADIRNLFSHGRDFALEFKDGVPDGQPMEINLDRHPLQHAASRLLKASIIKDFQFDSLNHDELRSAFYGDEALRYFYTAVNDIEKQLTLSRDFPPETFFAYVVPLPALA